MSLVDRIPAGLRADARAAAGGWLVARVVVLGALGVAHVVAAALDPDGLARGPRLAQGLLSWDGDWYHDIARDGYGAIDDEGLRFFPLFPMLARVLAVPLGGSVGLALLLLANGLALVAGALAHRIALVETGDPGLARRAAWLLALVPPFFVLVMGYTEPIALCLAMAMFLALRRRRWVWAASAGFLAGLTRPVGILLALPAAIEAARGWREVAGPERVRRLAAVAAPGLGVACYLVWVGIRFGDPLRPLTVQSSPGLRGGFALPVVPLWNALADGAGGVANANLARLPWLVVLAALVVVACRRLPGSYGVFAVATLVLAASTERWGSLERYGFGAFPVIFALAALCARPWTERAALVSSGALMGGYALLAFLDLYVP